MSYSLEDIIYIRIDRSRRSKKEITMTQTSTLFPP